MTNALYAPGVCPYCSTPWNQVYHSIGFCPTIEAIEYFENGMVKKVVFRENKTK